MDITPRAASRIGQQLRAARGEITLRQLAELAGFRHTTLHWMEQGKGAATFARWMAACRALGLDPQDLVFNSVSSLVDDGVQKRGRRK